MKILIIGNGGREHALAWKAAQSDAAQAIYVAPGNAGTAHEPGMENIAIQAHDTAALKGFALREEIDLTIVGPEAPLVAGIVNDFEAAGLKIFGPDRQAARLEGSKIFAKDFLKRHKIPTAEYRHYTDAARAIAHIKKTGAPLVIKADGLAAGKGVIVAQTEEQAIAATGAMLDGNRFGEAGSHIIIEQYLTGTEISFTAIVDGEHILPLAASQDYKARDNGDRGPNTGGMGACSPVPLVDQAMHERIMEEIMIPTVKGMNAEGNRYRGFLYAGLMIDAKGQPRVLEYNCRLGDPETQPLMLRLQTDLIDLCNAAIDGTLADSTIHWDERAALGVVMAAGGYPDHYDTGDTIHGLDQIENDSTRIFHAGTRMEGDHTTTAGGRVLCVTALGKTLQKAATTAYQSVKKIHWPNAHHRTDIGHRAMDSATPSEQSAPRNRRPARTNQPKKPAQ